MFNLLVAGCIDLRMSSIFIHVEHSSYGFLVIETHVCYNEALVYAIVGGLAMVAGVCE